MTSLLEAAPATQARSWLSDLLGHRRGAHRNPPL